MRGNPAYVMKGIHLLRGNPKGIHQNGPNHPSVATYMFYFGSLLRFNLLASKLDLLARDNNKKCCSINIRNLKQQPGNNDGSENISKK